MINHPTFGKLKYNRDSECWIGHPRLPLFAAIARRPEEPPMTPEQEAQFAEQIQSAARAIQQKLGELFGPARETLNKAFEAELRKAEEEDDTPDPREQRRRQREEKAKELLARGRFPIRISNPGVPEPTPQQEASFRFLTENEQTILAAVREAAFESYRSYYRNYGKRIPGLKRVASVEELAPLFAVTDVEFSREHRGGFAHLVFSLEAIWEDDHGLLIVFSPDTSTTTWTTYDGLEEILADGDESPQPPEEEPDPEAEKRMELHEAILSGDAKRARKLVADGTSVDPLNEEEYPLLHMAIDQTELEQVKLLLELGANPNVTEDITDGKPRTPLYKCRQLARTMGVLPRKTKKKDGLEEAMDGLIDQAIAGSAHLQEMGRNLLEIIRLLEEAGGKVKGEAG